MTETAKTSKKNARLKVLIDNEIATIDNLIQSAVEANKFECEVSGTGMTQTADTYEPTVSAEAHCQMDIYSFELDDINGADYRVNDILTFSKFESDNPTLVKVSEIDEMGNPIAFDIEQEGIYDEIDSVSDLKYYDQSHYVDITKPFGENGDIRINRDDTKQINHNGEWVACGNTYTSNDEPSDDFGEDNSVYISGNNALIKVNGKWINAHSVSSTLLMDSFGNEFDLAINLLGHNYVKIITNETPKWFDCGEIHYVTTYPEVTDYNNGDVVFYTTHRAVSDLIYKLVKNNNIWYQMKNNTEYDFTNKTLEELNDFGVNYDVISDGEISYVKLNGLWQRVVATYHSDSMFRSRDFGENYDIMISGNNTFCKLDDEWIQSNKTWNLNEYNIGHDESAYNISWNINNIVLDNEGDGYVYDTIVKIDGDSSIANVVVQDGKIKSVTINNKNKIYTHQPEIKFHMLGDAVAEKCYKVWKMKLKNPELQDAMKQVIEHYQDLNYSISRVTNKQTGNTFKWKLRWY